MTHRLFLNGVETGKFPTPAGNRKPVVQPISSHFINESVHNI